MKASIFFDKSKGYLQTTTQEFLQAAKQWLVETPERALNRAYAAALMIKSLNSEYFDKSTTSNNSNKHNDFVMFDVRANLGTLLRITRFRLAEFKTSYLLLGNSNLSLAETIQRINTNVEKLQTIDEVLDQYSPQEHSLSWLPLFQKQKKHSRPDGNNTTSPPKGDVPKKPLRDRSGFVTIEVQATKIP